MNQPDPGPVPELLERLGDRSPVPLLPLADIERNVRHRRRRTRAIGLTAGAVLIGATALGANQLLGPADDAGTTASDDTPAEVLQPVDLEGAWNVTAVRGDDGILTEDVALPGGGPVTLTFDSSDGAWGTTECNSFDADVQRGPEPNDVRVRMLRSSLVGCDETSQRRLAEVRSAGATSDTTAALLDEAGDIVLELQRQPFPDGQWTPDTVDGSEALLVFEDGSLSGNISCNLIDGTYVVDPARAAVQFGNIAVGQAGCGGDSSVVAVVRRVEHWSQTDGSQLLYDANWEVIAELEPLSS